VKRKRKNQAAAALGRKGGKQRAANRGWEKIPEEQRRDVARKAAQARWAKQKKTKKPGATV
jgi:hypothetical protein